MRNGQTTTSSRHKASAAAGLDCATAFQKMTLGCVADIKAHHASACAGDAEAVHQIRVAITRLRAAVAFFAPIVVDAEWLRLKKEIAWLNGPLGAARDSDVVMEYARRKRYHAWAQDMVGEQPRSAPDPKITAAWFAACAPRVRNASSRPWRPGSGKDRGCSAISGGTDAEALQPYCARELDRWHERLVRKGRHLKTLGASRRHRLRIKAKRFRYVLEALRETIALLGRSEFHHLHRPAKRLQRALGDMRDLERFAGLASGSPQVEDGKRGKKHPPGYRHRRDKLLGDAIAAHRDLKHAGAR